MERPTEGWILAGTIDGRAAEPAPLRPVCGVPHLLRDAITLANARVQRLRVVWLGDRAAPDIAHIARDSRLKGTELELVTDAGELTEVTGKVLVVRADRIYHRDIPRQLAAAAENADHVGVAGSDYDAAYALDADTARALVAAAPVPGGLAGEIANLAEHLVEIAPPYLGFAMATPDARSLGRAEKHLVTSLRKIGDGIASRYNRHVSLFLTRFLCKTPIRPNHVTAICFLLALAGGITMARGGYRNAVIGILLLELGSVLDGVDGELSRLKSWGSKLGEWMDTVTDDFGNMFFIFGASFNLDAAGMEWAWPVAIIAACSFFITQTSQYYLLAVVYKSGDLAAIPWAFQAPPEPDKLGNESFTERVKRNIPRLLKRDFFITFFTFLVIVGRLDAALLVFAAGGVSFLVAFISQFARWKVASRSL